MKKAFALLALLLCGAHAAHAQTTPQVLYTCQNTAASVPGTNAKDYVTCGANSWSWQPAPRRDADAPLVAACSTACGWGAGSTLVWRRPNQVLATERIAVCRRSPLPAAGTRGSCSPESFQLRDDVLPPPVVTNPPVNCVVSEWSEWTGGAWSACSLTTGKQSRTETRMRTVVTPASNGGAACPALSETRVVAQDCVLPGPTVFLTIDRNPILIGESVNVQWTSTNADACTATWAPANQPNVPLNSGPISIGPFTFAQTVSLMVTCRSFFGEYGSGVNLVVSAPPPRSPVCFPESKEDMAHVAWEPLALANWTTKYQAKAVWFCSSPTGPAKQSWVFGLSTVAANARRQLDGLLNWDDVRAQCEIECETLSDGPLKNELAAFAAQFTVEQLGVVE